MSIARWLSSRTAPFSRTLPLLVLTVSRDAPPSNTMPRLPIGPAEPMSMAPVVRTVVMAAAGAPPSASPNSTPVAPVTVRLERAWLAPTFP